ncbi:hypothetical protein ACFLV7_11200 [Chloroflexota bacterium]
MSLRHLAMRAPRLRYSLEERSRGAALAVGVEFSGNDLKSDARHAGLAIGGLAKTICFLACLCEKLFVKGYF